jgi:hypothetical protein
MAVVFSLLAAATSVAAAAGTPYSAKPTTNCLMAHHVLVSSQSRSQVLPPKLPATAVIQMSFALVPAQALDHGYVAFERDPATAKRVAAAWFTYSLKQASRVEGVDLSMLKITLKEAFTVRGNSITVWENQPKTASRRLISSCLR